MSLEEAMTPKMIWKLQAATTALLNGHEQELTDVLSDPRSLLVAQMVAFRESFYQFRMLIPMIHKRQSQTRTHYNGEVDEFRRVMYAAVPCYTRLKTFSALVVYCIMVSPHDAQASMDVCKSLLTGSADLSIPNCIPTPFKKLVELELQAWKALSFHHSPSEETKAVMHQDSMHCILR
jgi:hypothetical protein